LKQQQAVESSSSNTTTNTTTTKGFFLSLFSSPKHTYYLTAPARARGCHWSTAATSHIAISSAAELRCTGHTKDRSESQAAKHTNPHPPRPVSTTITSLKRILTLP
jgi:hypothetical protein